MFKKFFIYGALFISTIAYSSISEKQVQQLKKQLATIQQKEYKDKQHIKSNLKSTNIDAYLQYKKISLDPAAFTQEQIKTFFDENEDQYWSSALCDDLARYYAKNNNWQMFKQFYDGNLESAGKCWIIAQKASDEEFKRKAIVDFSKFTQTKKYSALECSDVDDYWKKQDSTSKNKDCVVEKAYKLAFEDNFDDALILLDNNIEQHSYNDYIKAWKKTTDNPQLLDGFIAKYHDYPEFIEVLAETSKDSVKTKLEDYAKIWLKLKNKSYLNDEAKSKATLPIAVAFAKNHNMQQAKEWFAKVDKKYYDDNAWAWLLRVDIYSFDSQNYINNYKNLPAKMQKENAWKYWFAYSYSKTGNKAKANEIYESLAIQKGFNYYTLLSADALGKKYVLGSDKVKLISKEKTTDFLKDRNISQAVMLYEAGQYKDSSQLWKWIIREKFRSQQRMQIPELAQLAWIKEMHYQAIFSMSMLGLDNHLELLYPYPFTIEVDDQSSKYNLQKALIFSIMRQESLFYREASSFAGAKGLMQVTDSTAGFVAKRYRLKNIDNIAEKLFTPNVNISVGSANLDFLNQLFKGNIILTIAAYNAGPGNVAKWLTKQEIPAKQWLESIPFGETRHYVRSVLVNMVIYNNIILKDKRVRLSDILDNQISNKLSFK
ncbi:hypothetical protein LO80_04015 [Candidatus Francisella endociliophora]|uniref:Transglycosylase SLT domain-containing protein n=1 Tax=Candidatus Francisella endociliophora TaxID=653937 RepID=A0A097ENT2_9GAMM|nr:lytic transglycosylase domain-containing protein [Francisella sp. FSC1006]AIT09220.1 hypothetical protein LO80_04015 [Francisella sp. FSC1006]